MIRKRFAAVFLTAAIIISQIVPAFASDIDSHWAKEQILTLSEYGIMQGNGSGTYRPDASITRAEFAALINRTFGFSKESDITFDDVTYSGDWKSTTVTRAATLGYMLGSNGKANPDGNISRQEAAAMLIRVLKLPLETGSTGFNDNDKISSWAQCYIATAAKYGIVTAMPSGNFEPTASLSRAQAATILTRAMGKLYQSAGTFEGGTISGNVTISAPGVTLQNTTISGNLYLTEGIGSGSVTLKNVTVSGLTFAAGGEASGGITAENCTFSGKLSVYYPNEYLSGVRFALSGTSSVKSADVKVPTVLDTAALSSGASGFSDLSIDSSACTSLSLNGNFGSVYLKDPKTVLQVSGGTLSSLTLSGSTASQKHQLNVLAGGIIGELNLDSPTTVTGEGTISNVLVNSSDSTIGSDINVNINTITLVNGVSIKVGNNTLMPYGESAELSNLVLKSADGTETIPMDAFSPSKIAYSAYTDLSSIRVYPYIADGNDYKIEINGEEVSSGSYITADTSDSIRIEVYCEGKNTTIYTITAAELSEPLLSNLTIYNSDNKIYPLITPSFDPDVTSYTVSTSGTNMKITATAESAGQTVKIGDAAAQSGTSTATAVIAASRKSVDIVVSNNVGQTKTYTVTLVKQTTSGAVYVSGTTEGSGTYAQWRVTVTNPSEGDTFMIEDKNFIVGELNDDCEQISRTNALSEIAEEYADHSTFSVSASGSTLSFVNKTAGAISSTSSVLSNVGTVSKTDGRNRKNGTTTITVASLPASGSDPVEIKVNSKTYRFCTSASDVETSYDISLVGVTTTSQAATLLEKKLSSSTTGGFLTSLSGSSIIVSAGETAAPTVTYGSSTLFTVTKSEGNAAEAETYTITFPTITEGMIISITVNNVTSDFEAHDYRIVSASSPAADIAKAFYSSIYKVTASNSTEVIFQSKLLGSSGNSQEIETSGSIISDPVQVTVGKDTVLGSANITVTKAPKYGDTLTIDSVTYVFGGTSGTNVINISGLSSTSDLATAIKKAIGTTAKASGSKVTISSQTAEPPEITFTAA